MNGLWVILVDYGKIGGCNVSQIGYKKLQSAQTYIKSKILDNNLEEYDSGFTYYDKENDILYTIKFISTEGDE